ncbi:MAG: hypothetical protein OXN89_24875 [Bryobacterales bacterium]|nr:hypothetical protein [Bryobacterales bacterium]
MFVGYASVSTVARHTGAQSEALERHGCERVFREKVSGQDEDRRRQTGDGRADRFSAAQDPISSGRRRKAERGSAGAVRGTSRTRG